MVLSFFLGGLGIDRFYVDDKGLGFAKLALTILTIVLYISAGASAINMFDGIESADLLTMGGSFIGAMISSSILSIWCFVDIFIIHSCAKKANAKRFYETIG